MNFEKIQRVNFISKFSDFEIVNSEFTRCRCYVLASGDNANGSDITEEAIDKAIARKEFFNKPIVAHLICNDDGSYKVGSHDSKVVLTNDGIEVINECVPFGTIPESANIRKERVLEPDGITYNNYLVMDIILWTGRYNIMDAAYSDNIYFNQSVEINVNTCHYKNNGVLAIDDFTFSACCLLGRSDDPADNHRPCFPSCRVEKISTYSFNETQFKQNFELMLEKLKTYKTGNNPVQDNSKIVIKEEKALNYENIKNAITSEMIPDSDVSRYAVLNCDDTSIVVFDRVDYSCYTIRYAVEKSEDTEKIIFDFNNRIDMAFSVVEKNADCYDFKSEFSAIVDRVSKDSAVYAVEKARAEFDLEKIAAVKGITDKYEALQQEFNYLKSEKDRADAKLAEYAKAEQMAKAEAHKNEIDAVIDRYADKLGTNPDYLIYKTTVDYSKEAKDVDLDMLVLLGKASMGTKSTFSYQSQKAVWGVNFSVNNEVSDTTGRYGDLFDKVKNK